MDDLLNCQIASQPPSNASFCPLLDISNELLHEILFYSLEFQSEHLNDEWNTITGLPYPAPKFALVLRSVCRHFRSLVNDMFFWYLPTFDPLTFLPESRQTVADQQLFLHLLLSDKHLAANFGRKPRWVFSTASNMCVVLKNVPYFRLNVVSIDFDDFVEEFFTNVPESAPHATVSSLNTSISLLRFCGFVTSLRVGPTTSSCDLDTISGCCPALKQLSLHDGGNLTGTLSLLYLQEFEIEIDDGDVTADHVSNTLPHLSVTSLCKLKMYCSNPFVATFCTKEIYDRYISLRRIEIDPVTPQLCDFLINTEIRLKKFSTTQHDWDPDLLRHLAEAFKSPSLSMLEVLSLFITTPDKHSLPAIEPIIVAITSNLRCLRFLSMQMGLDVHWCGLFSNLTTLECLIWLIRTVEDAFVSMFEGSEDEDMEERLDPSDESTKAFKDAFKYLENPPAIIIQEIDSEEEDSEEEE